MARVPLPVDVFSLLSDEVDYELDIRRKPHLILNLSGKCRVLNENWGASIDTVRLEAKEFVLPEDDLVARMSGMSFHNKEDNTRTTTGSKSTDRSCSSKKKSKKKKSRKHKKKSRRRRSSSSSSSSSTDSSTSSSSDEHHQQSRILWLPALKGATSKSNNMFPVCKVLAEYPACTKG
ncbi:uncharacterized protein LOC127750286 [Frankliniella occidentalis]|uniref:Uncharacterized protein LOC127750286 n=1 Tax=Frankliniella occidentalis TaxID=133901 RepID=A0A9C6XQE3_FRAOC|nr:uncharacterized protein LOC127750286 [Frankliniella occidentalis]